MVLLVFIFLLGLLVGSFLNLVIDRIPREEQILKGRSKCDSCQRLLAWYDLIPLVSWIFLAGRCRYCHSPIPYRNVLVELTTGLLFVSSIKYQVSGDFTSILYIVEVLTVLFVISSLIAIFFIDLEHKIIPDKIVYPAIVIAIINGLISQRVNESASQWSNASIISLIISGIGAAGFFLLLVWITKGRGMGMGDVKFAALMGLFLGFPKIIYALYFAFLTGGFLSVILILLRRKKIGQTIAFGPFLVLGTLFSYFNVLNFIVEKIW